MQIKHTTTSKLCSKRFGYDAVVVVTIVDVYEWLITETLRSLFTYTITARTQEFYEKRKVIEEQAMRKKKNRVNGFSTTLPFYYKTLHTDYFIKICVPSKLIPQKHIYCFPFMISLQIFAKGCMRGSR